MTKLDVLKDNCVPHPFVHKIYYLGIKAIISVILSMS
jgi:hypothetical protein